MSNTFFQGGEKVLEVFAPFTAPGYGPG